MNHKNVTSSFRCRLIFLLLLSLGLGFGWASPLFGLGSAEDPSQIITQVFHAEAPQTLTIRGQLHFTLEQGPEFRVVVKTNRAIMDQVTVNTFLGYGTVAVDSGLEGPREQGFAEAVIIIPPLSQLTISGQSRGEMTWSGAFPRLLVTENSHLSLTYSGPVLHAQVDWHSILKVQGKLDSVMLSSRDQGVTDFKTATIGTLILNLENSSLVEVTHVKTWKGTVRFGARAIWTPEPGLSPPQGTLTEQELRS
ncbi:MAG: hypothetical protein HKM05_11760 [Spirochaetales bacterium]|nr:hypothetical protein [Spirochaetales bacterium]